MNWLVKLIGGLSWQWLLAVGAALYIAGAAGGWWLHRRWVAADQVATLKTQIAVERQAAQLSLAVARAAEKITVQYVDRVKVVREKGETIIKEIPVYVKADSDCESLPAAWGVYHDAAAANTVPGDSGTADAAAARVDLTAAAGVIAENYTVCHENAEQLTLLQQWVAGRYAECAALKKTAP